MKAALLLIDLQLDFLKRAGLVPGPDQIISATAKLLDQARHIGLPVLHVRTRVSADGRDAMPHWREQGYIGCVAGTDGELSPPQLSPLPDEPVLFKRYFSGFEHPQLEIELRERGVDTLIMAGLYLHGCIRSTVLDAYARGFRVLVAEDAVASTDVMHAVTTRAWLDRRAASFAPASALLKIVSGVQNSDTQPDRHPVAVIGGVTRFASSDEAVITHVNPARTVHTVSVMAEAGKMTVEESAKNCFNAQQQWAKCDLKTRQTMLDRWKSLLASHAQALAALIVDEVGKPLADAQSEVQRSVALIAACIDAATDREPVADNLTVLHCPVGVIGMITPWNNPLAIPVGKLAPALIYGNGVVWKPSPQASLMAKAVGDTLDAAGFPKGLVNIVFGAADTVRHMMQESAIDAITFTGSTTAGATARALCSYSGKILQAELGGNNAAIVLADANLNTAMADLVQSAFNFSGQRCTAIRRFIVEKPLVQEFEQRMKEAIVALRIGYPHEPDSQIGPLISDQRRQAVRKCIADAIAGGARLVCGGHIPEGFSEGCWLAPTLLADVSPDANIVQQETFGPVAVIQEAASLDHAIELANAVPHGLVAGLIGGTAAARSRFIESIAAGIVKIGAGPVPVHPGAPFGGWKASGSGPPEHGRWNREFYAKPRAVYS